MKKILLLAGMVACMNASAFQLPQLTSIGMSQVTVPSGSLAVAYNGDRYNFSDKYESNVPTFNLRTSTSHLIDDKTLVRMKYRISTGHYSEALTVSPSISPSVEVIKEIGEDMFILFNLDLPTIGSIKEKKLIDKHGLDFSYATARPWSEYEQAKFNNGSKSSLNFQWKFHAPWGSKDYLNK